MTANPVDKLVLEWAYRCKKGYPDINNLEDKKVLEEIMQEWGVIAEATITPKGSKFTYKGDKWEVTKDSDSNTIEAINQNKQKREFKLSELGKEGINVYLAKTASKSKPVVDKQVKVSKEPVTHSTYVVNTLREAGVNDDALIEKIVNSPLFQAATSLESFVQDIEKYTDEFYTDLFEKTVSGGGRGELIPFVSIKGAKLGKLNEKDITVNGKVLEVKDLVDSKIFQTATGGSIAGTDFAKNIETFFKYLQQFDVSKDYSSTIDYYNENYGKGSFKTSELRYLTSIAKSLEKQVKDYKYVKIGNERYALSPGQKYSIELNSEGQLITNLPTADEFRVIESKLLKHPWVSTNGEQVVDDLEKIKAVYLDQVNFLLLYRKGKPLALTAEEAKSRLAPYRIAKGQLQLELLDS